MVRVGLVADTHVPSSLSRLPESLSAALGDVHHIIHAGDLVSLSVLEELGAMAPTTAVAGNCDPPHVARELPTRAAVNLRGRRVGVHHGHLGQLSRSRYAAYRYSDPEFDRVLKAMADQLPGADVIVFGHYHAPVVREWKGILFVNPGSIAPPHARPTFATLEISESVSARVHLLG